MKSLFLLLVLLPTTNGYGIQSQPVDLGEPWPIIEQCISLEAAPSPDWTFAGTLLLTSTDRLHAYRQEWDTPRIVAFTSPYTLSEELSPDGQWYAVVNGTVRTPAPGLATYVSTTNIQVFSTVDDRFYSILWENTYGGAHRIFGHRLYWVDERHLLYSMGSEFDETWFIIDPFSAETIPWNRTFDPHHFFFELSPDAQKGLSTEWAKYFWTIHTAEAGIEVPLQTTHNAVWHPSSEYFILTTWPKDSSEMRSVLMFDLNGEIQHHIYRTRFVPPSTFDAHNAAWSPDGRYLAFVDDRLYIADLERQHVTDTCIEPEGYFTLTWSPAQNQLAVMDSRSADRAIRIIDFDRSASYVVGHHQGSIIGWRADGEE